MPDFAGSNQGVGNPVQESSSAARTGSRNVLGSIFAAGFDYAESCHNPLPSAVDDALRIEGFFIRWGFTSFSQTQNKSLTQASAREFTDALEAWADMLRDTRTGAKTILYVAGHGTLHNGRHFVLTPHSPAVPPYFGGKAASVEDLAQAIMNSGSMAGLILLDTCYSGFAAAEIQQALDRAAANHSGPGLDLAVLVPSLHHQKSYSGLFVDGILTALEKGSEGGFWKDGDEFVTLFELREELRLRLEDDQCAYVAGRDGLKIIPNPRYRANAADRGVEMNRLLARLSYADREHFLQKAASTDAGDDGWFFVGRRQPSKQLIRWLAEAENGVLVVTGPPGVGKSAFLGRMAVLADSASQPACRVLGLFDDSTGTHPPIGSFDAVVHAKNRRVEEVASEIAAQLSIDLGESSNHANDLITALSDSRRRVTVLLDALDEAEPGEETLIARDVLRAIGGLSGCRVVVGTRQDRDGRHESGGENEGPLIMSLRPRSGMFTTLDLDADCEAEDAIERYVETRLADKWPTLERRRRAARAVRHQANRLFLVARFATHALIALSEEIVETQDWEELLPEAAGEAGLHQALKLDLMRYEDSTLIKEVLTPLALAHGRGLPRRVLWPELATALARFGSGRAYTAADISRTIREAGWHLVEGTEDGQSVFRLHHKAVADYFRMEATRASGIGA